MHSNLTFLRFLLTTWKCDNLLFYRHYLLTAGQLLTGNQLISAQLHLIFALLLIQILHHTYLVFIDHRPTPLESLIHANSNFGNASITREINLLFALMFTMAALFHHHFNLHASPQIVEHYDHLLFTQYRYNWLLPLYNGQRVTVVVRRFANRLVTILKPFFYVSLNYLLYSIYLFSGPIWKYRDFLFGSLEGFLLYLLHWFNLLRFITAILLFTYLSILVACFGMAGLKALYIHAIQHLVLLRAACRNYNTRLIDNFKAHDIEMFRYIFMADRTFGYLLLYFLLFTFPLNAYLSIGLISGTFTGLSIYFVLVLISQSFIGILCVHMYIAGYSRTLYRSADFLLHLMVANQHRIGHLQVRFDLCHLIMRLHTTNKIGIRYGDFGLVTPGTFAKCLALYGQFLLTLYQLMYS